MTCKALSKIWIIQYSKNPSNIYRPQKLCHTQNLSIHNVLSNSNQNENRPRPQAPHARRRKRVEQQKALSR